MCSFMLYLCFETSSCWLPTECWWHCLRLWFHSQPALWLESQSQLTQGLQITPNLMSFAFQPTGPLLSLPAGSASADPFVVHCPAFWFWTSCTIFQKSWQCSKVPINVYRNACHRNVLDFIWVVSVSCVFFKILTQSWSSAKLVYQHKWYGHLPLIPHMHKQTNWRTIKEKQHGGQVFLWSWTSHSPQLPTPPKHQPQTWPSSLQEWINFTGTNQLITQGNDCLNHSRLER